MLRLVYLDNRPLLVCCRVTQKPTQVGKYTIPGDVLVAAPLYALQNSRHNWKNPSQFKPERWMDVPVETFVTGTNKEKPSQSITFMPFSYGPRSCVGQSLAKMEVMALLAKLLGTFHFALAPEVMPERKQYSVSRALTFYRPFLGFKESVAHTSSSVCATVSLFQ